MADSIDLSNVVDRAMEFVAPGMTLGLGSGRASTAFIHALGERVRAGLDVRGVPTSIATERLARTLGIPLVDLDAIETIDFAFDGADEVDPRCDVIKGYGAALVREKVVAASAKTFVVLVGSEKLVTNLGERGRLPVEVLPFALGLCRRRLRSLGLRPEVRLKDGDPLTTDNGNWILDCGLGPQDDPAALDKAILDIPGVLGTGLFINMVDVVLISQGSTIEVRKKP
ncbi:MAG: ribose-5-phosphate isomerase RpiA [Pirellulales bacterium]